MCCAQVALLRRSGAFAAADPSADPVARRWWPLLLPVLAEAARDLLTSVPELCQLCIHGQPGSTKVSGGCCAYLAGVRYGLKDFLAKAGCVRSQDDDDDRRNHRR